METRKGYDFLIQVHLSLHQCNYWGRTSPYRFARSAKKLSICKMQIKQQANKLQIIRTVKIKPDGLLSIIMVSNKNPELSLFNLQEINTG